jgi:hypothetical protein
LMMANRWTTEKPQNSIQPQTKTWKLRQLSNQILPILDKSVEPDTPPQQTIQLDIFHSTFIFLERKNPTALKVEINSFFF